MTNSDLKINLIQYQPPNDSVLFRYITIDKLLDFLLCGRIPLIRLSEFKDRLEGVNLNHILMDGVCENISENTMPFVGELARHVVTNIIPSRENSLKHQREIFQNINYASCWYLNNYESVAMWQLYSRSDSVAIRIPYSELSNEILNKNFELPKLDYTGLKFGAVNYYKFSDIGEIVKILNNNVQGFVKDLSFQHEHEFRIILQTQESERLKTDKRNLILKANNSRVRRSDSKVIYMKFDNFTKMHFELIFHPQACLWHMESINTIIRKFDLPFKTKRSVLRDIFN